MPKVIVVRSPEADFRPEKWIANHVVKYLQDNKIPIFEVKIMEDFKTLDSQSMFYDNNTMTDNYGLSVLEVCKQVEDGDVIYFNDGWNPAIPLLKSHLFFCGMKNVKLIGLFHSSVETPGDLFYEGGTWIRSLENTIIDCLDTLFVATQYGVEKLKHYSAFKKEKVVISSLPIISPQDTGINIVGTYANSNKPIVGFSHRWAEDKQPDKFIKLAQLVRERGLDARFVVLHPIPLSDESTKEAKGVGIEFILCPDKSTYWDEVSKLTHIFSSATLETFGYSVIDAVILGAVPIVPNRAVYPYLYPEYYVYSDLDEAAWMITERPYTSTEAQVLGRLIMSCNKTFESAIRTNLVEALSK